MNCADCGQLIRPTEERDGIERHDGRYEFEYVHDDGNPVCDGTFTARPHASRLTDADRRAIDRGAEVAAVAGLDAVMERTGEADIAAAYAGAFGLAQWVIGDLLAIIERLDGDG